MPKVTNAVDRVPWVVYLVAGLALLGFGIATGSRPAEYGGPIILGLMLILLAFVSGRRRRGASSPH